MTHTITLPHSAFLGNFEKFTALNTFPTDSTPITLSTPKGLISLHPVIGAMLQPLLTASSTHLATTTTIQSSFELDDYFRITLPSFQLNPTDLLLVKYILSELTRNTLEHARDPRGSTIALAYAKKSHTLRLGVADRGIGIRQSIAPDNPKLSDHDAIISALTPGVTGTTITPGGSTQNAGAGLFFVKSLAHQLGSHFLLYSGSGLFKLLKRKTVRNILRADSTRDHASGGNNYPYWQGTAVGVDIPLDKLADFNTALSQIRTKFINTTRPEAQFI